MENKETNTEQNMEQKGKFVNFLYTNKAQIGAVITTAALVIGMFVGMKSCSTSQGEDETNSGIERVLDDSDIQNNNPDETLDGNSEENLNENSEIDNEAQNNSGINNNSDINNNRLNNNGGNQSGNQGGNQDGNQGNNQGSNQGGNQGGNTPGESEQPPKPVEPDKPIDPQPHTHSLVSNYEAHDENETCVVTRWQICTDSNCPDGAGKHLNQKTTRQSHQYMKIAEAEIRPGLYQITSKCTTCNHTQREFLTAGELGYSTQTQNLDETAEVSQTKVKTLSL